jgi:hypothetical protein
MKPPHPLALVVCLAASCGAAQAPSDPSPELEVVSHLDAAWLITGAKGRFAAASRGGAPSHRRRGDNR